MEHIVVTTDFSECAARAFAVARQHYQRVPGAKKMTLLSVIEDVVPVGVQFEFAITLFDPAGVMQEAEKQGRKKLERIAATEFPDIPLDLATIQGTSTAAKDIVEFLVTSAATLAIMSTHGRTGVEHMVLGSVVERVIRAAPCPVLVVPGAHPSPAHSGA